MNTRAPQQPENRRERPAGQGRLPLSPGPDRGRPDSSGLSVTVTALSLTPPPRRGQPAAAHGLGPAACPRGCLQAVLAGKGCPGRSHPGAGPEGALPVLTPAAPPVSPSPRATGTERGQPSRCLWPGRTCPPGEWGGPFLLWGPWSPRLLGMEHRSPGAEGGCHPALSVFTLKATVFPLAGSCQ